MMESLFIFTLLFLVYKVQYHTNSEDNLVEVVHGAYRWCDSQKDCNSNECCVTNNPPDGKRFITDSGLGHCVALGQTGSGCYVRYGSASTPPTGVVFGCPCASPLTCHGSHMIEVPLGEVGTCG